MWVRNSHCGRDTLSMRSDFSWAGAVVSSLRQSVSMNAVSPSSPIPPVEFRKVISSNLEGSNISHRPS